MGFDPREGEGEMGVVMLLGELGIGEQGDRLALIEAPGAGGRDLSIGIAAGQASVIGCQQVAALRFGNERDELLPFVGEHRSEEHTSELQTLMRIAYAVFCLTQKSITEYIIYSL